MNHPNSLKSLALSIGLASILANATTLAQQAPPPAVKPDASTSPAPAKPAKPETPPADVAEVKVGHDGQPDRNFLNQHEAILRRGKAGPIDLLFIGDSITQIFIGSWGKEVWANYYGKLHAANFGIGGDRTQHLLWRIENGELDGIAPMVVVLLIGTNNISGHNTAEDILKAERKIVDAIHAKLPHSKLILIGIIPRAQPYQATVEVVNKGLAKLDDGKKTRFLDVGPKFQLPEDMSKDWVHINDKGYEVWAKTMQPLLDELMK